MKKNMLIAGNWKMNTNSFEATKLIEYVAGGVAAMGNLAAKVLVCPPFTSIESVAKVCAGTGISHGAQNCHFEAQGAFTGEISIPMLKHLNCCYIIIGHSERRAYFGETDEFINKKLKAILSEEITPVLCIGETLDERNSGKTFDVLEKQLKGCLAGISSEEICKVVVAYEPVWAIGTGVSATNEQVAEAHDKLRAMLMGVYGEVAENIYLLYGGSLNEKNAAEILSNRNVNGGLIGGASLKGDAFLSIIKTANEIVG